HLGVRLVQPLREGVPCLVLALDYDRAVERADVDVAAVVLAVERLPSWPDALQGEEVLHAGRPAGTFRALLAHAACLLLTGTTATRCRLSLDTRISGLPTGTAPASWTISTRSFLASALSSARVRVSRSRMGHSAR